MEIHWLVFSFASILLLEKKMWSEWIVMLVYILKFTLCPTKIKMLLTSPQFNLLALHPIFQEHWRFKCVKNWLGLGCKQMLGRRVAGVWEGVFVLIRISLNSGKYCQRQRREPLGVSRGNLLPQKMLKSRNLEMLFSVVSTWRFQIRSSLK